MECKCGGQFKDMKSKIKKYLLTFSECIGCGRVGNQKMYKNGVLFAIDNDAAAEYEKATGGNVK